MPRPSSASLPLIPTHLGIFVLDSKNKIPLEGIHFLATAEYQEGGQFIGGKVPLGILSTDHVGYISYDLRHLELIEGKNLEDIARKNFLEHLWIYPMGRDDLAIDVLKYAQLKPDSVFIKVEIERPASRLSSRLPSMQNPCLSDWNLSPGSFTINPSLITDKGGCEVIAPLNLDSHEYIFRQIARKHNYNSQVSAEEGYVYEYKIKWQPIGQSLGQIVYSLPLAPCESVNIAVIDWSRKDLASRTEDLTVKEQLLHNLHRERSIEESIHASLSEWQRGGSIMGGVAASYMNVSGAIGGAYTTSSGDRNLAANTIQQLSDNISQATTAMRKLNSTIVVQSSQQEKEIIETRTVTNHNHCHAMTVLYYEILRHFKVETKWSSERPVLLVKYSIPDFDEQTVLDNLLVLESVLLDESLRESFNVIRLLSCIDKDLSSGLRPWNEYEFDTFTVKIKTGKKGTRGGGCWIRFKIKSGEYIRTQLLNPDGDPRHGEGSDKFYLPEFTSSTGVQRSLHTNEGDEGIYTLRPYPTDKENKPIKLSIKWGDISAIQIGQYDTFTGDEWPDPSDWEIANVIASTSHGDDIWIMCDWPKVELAPLIVKKSGDVEIPVTPFVPALHNQRCNKNLLLQHFNSNRLYYYRAIWLAEDQDQRAVRLSSISNPIGDGTILDAIENRILGVYGDHVAFPIAGSIETMIKYDNGRTEKVNERLSKLVSLPVRGIFAEAKLGHCNSCEETDITRFWDWQKSPCERPTEISPITAVTPTPIPPVLTPTSLPSSIVNIVNPPNAPDPTAMAGALNLLAQPGIFRDMSAIKEVSALLQKLAGGTISAAEAQAEAKKLTSSSSGSTSGGRSYTTDSNAARLSPSEQHDQMQVIDNARNKDLITEEQRKKFAGNVLENATMSLHSGVGGRSLYTVGVDTNSITTSEVSCISTTTISFTHWDNNTYTGQISFVARYLFPHSNALTVSECEALAKAGLQIVSAWEMSAASSRMTFANGQLDADRAFDEANKLGQPNHAPIYFAIDFPAAGHLAKIKLYFEGIADRRKKRIEDSKPVYPVGVYGTKLLFDFLYGLGATTGWLATYYWQAGSPKMDTGNDVEFVPGNIWQIVPASGDKSHCGLNFDYNVALTGNPGSWILSTP